MSFNLSWSRTIVNKVLNMGEFEHGLRIFLSMKGLDFLNMGQSLGF